MNRFVFACVLAAAFGIAPALPADTVYLRDGRTFEGTITLESAKEVEIEALVHGIPVTMRFDMSEVDRIERSDEPPPYTEPGAQDEDEGEYDGAEDDGAFDSFEEDEDDRPSARDGSEPLYVEIPMVGGVGREIFAEGVDRVLKWARRNDVEHALFVVDTPGGLVSEADAIAAVMAEHQEHFTYHAFVREALSAGIWILLSCDTVTMMPESSTGAAVGYSRDHSTGEVAVDAKFNSAMAGRLASKAEARGRPGDAVRAMIVVDATLDSWEEEDGAVRVGPEAPEGAREVVSLDSSDSVLTLTARQALRIGFADAVSDNIAIIPTLAGLEGGWASAGPYGERAMEHVAKREGRQRERVEKLMEELDELVSMIGPLAERAHAADPANDSYTYYRGSGLLTDESQRRWKRNSDNAIRAWRDVLEAIRRIERRNTSIERLTGDRVHYELGVKNIEVQAKEQVRRLQNNYNYNGL